MGCSGSDTFTNSKSLKFAVAIDGSEHAEMGFQKIINEKFKPGNKLYLIHIFNQNKYAEMPLEKLPEHLLPKYEKALNEKIINKNDFEVIKRKKADFENTPLESVLVIANEKNTDLLVVGAVGHKGLKKSKSLCKGLHYLIQNCKIPTLVMKHYKPPSVLQKGSIWLVCIKDDNDRSFRSFEFTIRLIDKEKDSVIGIHFIGDKFSADNVKKNFYKRCKENKVINRSFIARENDKSQTLGKNILDYLIFGQETIEYVVVNHNIQKYMDLEKCPSVELIKYGSHNVIFCRE